MGVSAGGLGLALSGDPETPSTSLGGDVVPREGVSLFSRPRFGKMGARVTPVKTDGVTTSQNPVVAVL